MQGKQQARKWTGSRLAARQQQAAGAAASEVAETQQAMQVQFRQYHSVAYAAEQSSFLAPTAEVPPRHPVISNSAGRMHHAMMG